MSPGRTTAPPKLIALAALFTCAWNTAAAQTSKDEFWPKVQSYVKLNEITRIYILSSFTNHQTGDSWRGTFGAHLDFALKPVFQRDLRDRDDVLNRKYLTFQVGYRYITSLTDGAPYTEQRDLVEFTTRGLLPGNLVASDRNRGEFRFIRGQPLSERYRNRMQLERDFRIARVVYTPFINGEVFYDTRYDGWTQNRYSAGVQIPIRPRFVLAAYYQRQNDSRSHPPHTNALGLEFKFYF